MYYSQEAKETPVDLYNSRGCHDTEETAIDFKLNWNLGLIMRGLVDTYHQLQHIEWKTYWHDYHASHIQNDFASKNNSHSQMVEHRSCDTSNNTIWISASKQSVTYSLLLIIKLRQDKLDRRFYTHTKVWGLLRPASQWIFWPITQDKEQQQYCFWQNCMS